MFPGYFDYNGSIVDCKQGVKASPRSQNWHGFFFMKCFAHFLYYRLMYKHSNLFKLHWLSFHGKKKELVPSVRNQEGPKVSLLLLLTKQ